MKLLKTVLPSLILVIFTGEHVVSKGSPTTTKQDTKNNEGVLLVYVGTISSGPMSMDIGYHVEMDPKIGLRCDITFERGDKVVSHNALFYKFSSPDHTVFYNYLTHKSSISKYSSTNDDPIVIEVGRGQIGKYACVHLKNKSQSSTDDEDYWMSDQVPGYKDLEKILKNISKAMGMPQITLNGSIFQWGGLVKWTATYSSSEGSSSVNLNLVEANPNMSFPARDFDVPKN